MNKSFSLGESDLPTLLRARAAAFDAQAELRRLEVARHAADSRLRQALGVVP
jgi:cobalt-zinc-cadmium efflux system outer membrane protein